MNKRILLPLLVLVIGGFAVYGLMTGRPVPEPIDSPAGPATAVDVFIATPESVRLTVSSQGTIRPHRAIDIVAQVGGKVDSVSDVYLNGDFFTEGQQLLRIEDADFRFAVIRAESIVAEAKELLATIKGQALQAKREWRDLGNEDANALFLKKPQLRAAEARVAAAKSDLSQAKLSLQRTVIRAPFDGRIEETLVNLGQYVAPGAAIAKIYATDKVEVRLPLTDRQIALLDLPLRYQNSEAALSPTKVELSADFGGQRWQWQGYIKRTSASIDVQNRVLYALAEIDLPFAKDESNRRPPLTVGQFVEAKIEGRELDNILLLPRKALQPGNLLWLVDADDKLQSLPIELIKSTRQQVAVRAEVAGEVRVLVSALDYYVVGLQVAPKAINQPQSLNSATVLTDTNAPVLAADPQAEEVIGE
ncbi:Efflux pump periplasmic linker BepF [Sinobacterium norvegicum]|uniref:Efflux pump periplasmic linker BepF n=1 Tax=Sinobacterium norvegicum TaxID=1641715 RepID=A0ABN8EHA8_9GAMM|nr:efflux RND transporter periplasmic adaptor subunit [Sinobacterium norvegicum]CAH0991821.1 Efflux pump periplasmic linker BepF [Sinobacterium norvegicum]